jgi:uncharacterized protein YehS (DUF1456 family)
MNMEINIFNKRRYFIPEEFWNATDFCILDDSQIFDEECIQAMKNKSILIHQDEFERLLKYVEEEVEWKAYVNQQWMNACMYTLVLENNGLESFLPLYIPENPNGNNLFLVKR